MGRIQCEPDAVREFMRNLQQFQGETRDRLLAVRGQLQDMSSSSWKDDRQKQFQDLFEDMEKQLMVNLDVIESEHVPFLNDVIQRAEDYLNS